MAHLSETRDNPAAENGARRQRDEDLADDRARIRLRAKIVGGDAPDGLVNEDRDEEVDFADGGPDARCQHGVELQKHVR